MQHLRALDLKMDEIYEDLAAKENLAETCLHNVRTVSGRTQEVLTSSLAPSSGEMTLKRQLKQDQWTPWFSSAFQ